MNPAPTGVVHSPAFAPGLLSSTAQQVDASAIDELWLWEDCFLQGAIAQAAVALATTRNLVVGIGVMPAPLRGVVATAMEIATLARMFPGRIKVGIGHGVQSWMRQAGVAVSSPMTLLTEYVAALRDLLGGETVHVRGRYVRLTDVALQWLPVEPVPVLIGATGPRTLRLAGAIGDGVILDCQHTVATVREALAQVAAARSDPDTPFSNVMYLACAPGPDAESRLAREAGKWNVKSPNDFGVGGSAAQILAGSAAYRDAGVDTLAYQSVGGDGEMAALVRAIDGVARL